MNTDKYSIHIFKDISEPELISHWKRIEDNSDCHPQIYYEWCEPWWRRYSLDRELHIVAVKNENKILVGIAPLCIEKSFGVKIIRSIPIRFGDFYSFIIENGEDFDKVISIILQYLKSYKEWQIIQLSQINNNFQIWNHLIKDDFTPKHLSKIHTVNLDNYTFTEFLDKLPKNLRKQFRNRYRNITKLGKLELECIENGMGFKNYIGDMKNIYNYRRKDNALHPPSEMYYSVINDAVNQLYDKKNILLFLLKLNDEIIAYRFGVVKDGVYYAWKVSHNPKYNAYYPGMLIIGKIVEELINRKYKKFNFGVGDYEWKRRWASSKLQSANYEFIAGCSNLLKVKLYIKYRLKWRDKLISFYFTLTKLRVLRVLGRIIIKRK
jgi:CelD/BcsL family acetyltransferase involved in cellulose biosynthesis